MWRTFIKLYIVMKEKFKFLSLFYIWMLIGIPLVEIAKLLNVDVKVSFNSALLNFISEIIMFTLCFIFYHETFKKDFKEVKKNKSYLKDIIKLYVGELVVSISASIVIINLANMFGLSIATSSENNMLAQKLLKSAPIFMSVGIAIIGPVYEEGIMRLGLKKGIKNKGVFAIVSGFIFGIIHVVDNLFIILTLPILGFLLDEIMNIKDKKKYLLSATSIIAYIGIILGVYFGIHHNLNGIIDSKNIIYGISYVSIGTYFAVVYLKKNNIFYTIGTHMLVNTIATIFLFFI